MPQLIPFFFLNQLSFSFLTLLALIYIFSKYILPLFTFQQVIRMYITKLSKKNKINNNYLDLKSHCLQLLRVNIFIYFTPFCSFIINLQYHYVIIVALWNIILFILKTLH